MHAVSGVSFDLSKGQSLGIVGESGSGKSVLAKALMNLLPRTAQVSGEMIYSGRDLRALATSGAKHFWGVEMTMVLQDPMTSLHPAKKIGEQVAETLRYHLRRSRRDAKAEAVDLLDRVGVPEPRTRAAQYPHELSGGLRQRAAIAVALACRPRLLIADEPTTAVDATVQKRLLNLLDRLCAERGMAMILITHDLAVVRRTDDVAVMYAGRIVEQADPGLLFNDMRHPYTEALLHSIPRMSHPSHHRFDPIPGRPSEQIDPPDSCSFAPRCRYVQSDCLHAPPQLIGEGERTPFRVWLPRWHRPRSSIYQGQSGCRCHRCGFGRRRLGRRRLGRRWRSSRGHATRWWLICLGDSRPPAEIQPMSRPRPHDERLLEMAGSGRAQMRDRDDILLSVRDLVVTYPLSRKRVVQAVSCVAFDVAVGETLGIVGDSGCGKSTVAKAIVRLVRIDSGGLRYREHDLAQLSGEVLRGIRPRIQMIFQDPISSLNPRRRVRDVIKEGLEVWGDDIGPWNRGNMDDLMEAVGMDPSLGDRRPHEFSGGQCQRIGIARALALHPEMLICDEPVSALDVSVQAQILNLLQDMKNAHGLTMLFISHDLAVVKNVSDRILVMYLGKVCEIGAAEEIYERPAHPYTRLLLASTPEPAASVDARESDVMGDLPSPINPPSGCRFHPRCPRASDRCRLEEPVITPVDLVDHGRQCDGIDHFVACHHPVGEPVEVLDVAIADEC